MIDTALAKKPPQERLKASCFQAQPNLSGASSYVVVIDSTGIAGVVSSMDFVRTFAQD